MLIDDRTEWLEADGLGGFASGTTSGVRTRRYHALLLTAATPPTGRMVLVNGFDAVLVAGGRQIPISRQRYHPGDVYPADAAPIVSFTSDPWPTWEFDAGDGVRLLQEIAIEHGTGHAVVRWTLLSPAHDARLEVRPFLSGRDYHSLHHENGAFAFEPERGDATLQWRPYSGIPAVRLLSNGEYRHAPEWYRNFLYLGERERGLDDTEDLASPGVVTFRLGSGATEAVFVLGAGERLERPARQADVVARATAIFNGERSRRAAFADPLARAADAYVVRRGAGRTIVAGYPWFTDWGRDTFISLRGLCLATGRHDVARDIVVEWAGAVSEGMLPNRFPDGGETPEYNAVDASLWYVIAAGELLDTVTASKSPGAQTAASGVRLSSSDREKVETAIQQILSGYAAGTRYGIRMDDDGLVAAGAPGVQLTWMDARVGDRVITPRSGKPVEVQALWLNALACGARIDPQWQAVYRRGRSSFVQRFWNPETGSLHDVVDVDHQRGTADPTFRPNQILAVGGLPIVLLDGATARSVVDGVERRLLTPLGLRSLAPGEPGYASRYAGGPSERDGVYHQGTVWPWLMGAFIEAWVRVRGAGSQVRREAAARFLPAMREHLRTAGLGHVSEVTDAEPPFSPGGCPFQAWSLAELIRVERLLAQGARPRAHARGRISRVSSLRTFPVLSDAAGSNSST